jgi:hypothetical protein
MASIFTIQTSSGPKDIEGTILKYGKGKKAIPLIGIAKESYKITHIPSGKSLTRGYEYLSQARLVANEILQSMGANLISPDITPEAFPLELRLYLDTQWLSKEIPSLEEYCNGPDYEARVRQSHPGKHLSSGENEEYSEELPLWDTTLAWVPSPKGPISGGDLRALVEGKPFDSQSIRNGGDE